MFFFLFQTELTERLRLRRGRGDTSEDDEGLPHSPCNSPTASDGLLVDKTAIKVSHRLNYRGWFATPERLNYGLENWFFAKMKCQLLLFVGNEFHKKKDECTKLLMKRVISSIFLFVFFLNLPFLFCVSNNTYKRS